LFIFTYLLFVHAQASGVGLAFSGAGGRIGQHIALAEALIEGTYPGAQPIRPGYLSGASSGAITSVLLNAVIQHKETGVGNWTWDVIKSILFHLQTGDVIDDSILGILRIEENIRNGFILDNTPLINFLKRNFQTAGYNKFGDLYIPTSISLVNQSSGLTHRFWSDDPQYAKLDLLDLVIGSSSLPLAFLPRKINGLGDTIWIDGGTGIDTLPVYPLLQRKEVTSIFTACYNSAFTSGGGSEPAWLDNLLLLKNGLAAIDDMRVDLFVGGVDIVSSQTTKPAYMYIPALNQTFSVLDFDHEQLEYTLTAEWTKLNKPNRLN